MRMEVAVGATLVVAALAVGQEPATPTPARPGPRAAEVLAAFDAKEVPKLKRLAAQDDPDPWLVADELLRSGKRNAAAAFAAAVPRFAMKQLPDYVAQWRPTPKAHAAYLRADELFEKRRFAESLAIIDAASSAAGVTGVRLLHLRALVLGQLGRNPEVIAACRAASDAAARIGWPMRAAWTAMMGMQLAAGNGAFAAALPLAERAAQLYDALGDSDRAIDAYMRLGMFRMALGSNAAAIPSLERALELLGDDGDARQRYVTLFTLGGVYSMAGDHEGALKRFGPALKLAEEQRNWTDALSIRGRTANLLRLLGRTEEAVADLRAALELSRTHKVRVMEARVLRELGAILRKGQPAAARRYLEDALKVLAGLNEPVETVEFI